MFYCISLIYRVTAKKCFLHIALHAEGSETESTREEQTQVLLLYDFNNCNALVMIMIV